MTWFIMYICFGAMTTFICTMIDYNDNKKVDREAALVTFCFWFAVIPVSIYLVFKNNEESSQ